MAGFDSSRFRNCGYDYHNADRKPSRFSVILFGSYFLTRVMDTGYDRKRG